MLISLGAQTHFGKASLGSSLFSTTDRLDIVIGGQDGNKKKDLFRRRRRRCCSCEANACSELKPERNHQSQCRCLEDSVEYSKTGDSSYWKLNSGCNSSLFSIPWNCRRHPREREERKKKRERVCLANQSYAGFLLSRPGIRQQTA
jgi:hypothetical protein